MRLNLFKKHMDKREAAELFDAYKFSAEIQSEVIKKLGDDMEPERYIVNFKTMEHYLRKMNEYAYILKLVPYGRAFAYDYDKYEIYLTN